MSRHTAQGRCGIAIALKTTGGVPGRAQASTAPCPHPLPLQTWASSWADRRQVRGWRAPASPSPSSVTP